MEIETNFPETQDFNFENYSLITLLHVFTKTRLRFLGDVVAKNHIKRKYPSSMKKEWIGHIL